MRLLQAALTCALAATASENSGLTVHTKQGDVLGTQVSPGVRRFLGIPFAVAKRWEAPHPPVSRNKTFSASAFGPSCPQSFIRSFIPLLKVLNPDSLIPVTESEDCLSVSIWAPSVHRKQKTAVLLWIYGGAFQVGTSNVPLYDGQSLVQNHEDITFVSFNYRLNILGQPGAPQLHDQSRSQNFGMLDVDAAVQWVYENIASFGGDPERIVLFGESAGSVTVDAYTYTYPQDKRVKGVIQESGTLGLLDNANGTFNPTPWNTVAKAVGCGNVTGSEQLDCLKRIPYKILVNAAVTTNTFFYPIADGITIFADTRERAAAGNFLRVPLLGGTNAQESDWFVVASQYASPGYTIPVLTELLSDLLTQIDFACPAAVTSNDRIKANVPTWRYLFSAISRILSPLPELRAYHSSEMPFVFGVFPKGTQEFILSQYIQGAWVAFARDPVNGLANYGWPRYTPDTKSLVELGGFYNHTGSNFLIGERLDSTCKHLDTLVEVYETLLKLFPGVGPIF